MTLIPWQPTSTTIQDLGEVRIYVTKFATGNDTTDITYWRGVPTQIQTLTYNEPFGDAAASLVFPQISPFESLYAPSNVLINTVTGRTAYTGPAGEPGYGAQPTNIPGVQQGTMLDGRPVWYVPGTTPDPGNVGALANWRNTPKPILINVNTGQPLYCGPSGEPGFATQINSRYVLNVMPDTRVAWYLPGSPPDQGNLTTLHTYNPFNIAPRVSSWYEDWANIDIKLFPIGVTDPHQAIALFEGLIASVEETCDETNFSTTMHCIGALYQLDLYVRAPSFFLTVQDIGEAIENQFSHQSRPALRCTEMPKTVTGIGTSRKGFWNPVLTGYIQDLLTYGTPQVLLSASEIFNDACIDAEGDGYFLLGNLGTLNTFGPTTHFFGSQRYLADPYPVVDVNIPAQPPPVSITNTLAQNGLQASWFTGIALWYGGLVNTRTGRAAFTGPFGEPGYGVLQVGAQSWTMPDNRVAWYFPGTTPDPGNIEALNNWNNFTEERRGKGYWLCDNLGNVWPMGGAPQLGPQPQPGHVAIPGLPPGHNIIDIQSIPNASFSHIDAYYLVSDHGEVYTFGSAIFYGAAPQNLTGWIMNMSVTPSGNGYAMVSSDGHVYTFGDAQHWGDVSDPSLITYALRHRSNASGTDVGYWTLSNKFTIDHPAYGPYPFGFVTPKRDHADTYGIVQQFGSTTGTVSHNIDNPAVDIISVGDGNGYYLFGEDGSVYNEGDATYYGSMPDSAQAVRFDITDVDMKRQWGPNLYQWTLTKGPLRTPRLMIKDSITKHWHITTGAPGLSIDLSRDFAQSATTYYGEGTDINGCHWRNSKFPDAFDTTANTSLDPNLAGPGKILSYGMQDSSDYVVNTDTLRMAWTGPAGEPGYGTPQPDSLSWKMPDGRIAWYYPGTAPDFGNVQGLANFNKSNASSGRLINTITGKPAFTGPNGEYGYGADPGPAHTNVMPDGRLAYYFPGPPIDPGNLAALANYHKSTPIYLTNTVTGRRAYTGPQGQPGYATTQTGLPSYIQVDGTTVWFAPYSTPDPGNLGALASWRYNPLGLTLRNTITGRPAFTGPQGEPGYGTGQAQQLFQFSWTMPDGRQAWYYYGQPPDSGNLSALQGWPYTQSTAGSTQLINPNTGRPAWTGPAGEYGYAVIPSVTSKPQLDGVLSWYVVNGPLDPGNVGAIANWKATTHTGGTGDGHWVALWQHFLRIYGYTNLIVTGWFDSPTVGYTRDFQSRCSGKLDPTGAPVTVNGTLDPPTWYAAITSGLSGNLLPGNLINGGPYFAPLAEESNTDPYVYGLAGKVIDRKAVVKDFNGQSTNPNYFNQGRVRVERFLNYGAKIAKQTGIDSARNQLLREGRGSDPGWLGHLTLKTDPEEGSRFMMRAGQNIVLRAWNGKETMFHISQVNVNLWEQTVDLSVDEHNRDLMTLGAIYARDRDTTDVGRRQRLHHRTSRMVHDTKAMWDCLPIGTMVATSRGWVAIEEIVPDDNVWSWNDETRVVELQPVEISRTKGIKDVIEIKTGRRTIQATANHKILRATPRSRYSDPRCRFSDRSMPDFWSTEWVTIDQLQKGDQIVVADNLPDTATLNNLDKSTGEQWDFSRDSSKSLAVQTVQSIEPAGRTETWDIQVAKTHNFVAEGVIVHNCESGSGIIPRTAVEKGSWHIFKVAAGERGDIEHTQFFATNDQGVGFQGMFDLAIQRPPIGKQYAAAQFAVGIFDGGNVRNPQPPTLQMLQTVQGNVSPGGVGLDGVTPVTGPTPAPQGMALFDLDGNPIADYWDQFDIKYPDAGLVIAWGSGDAPMGYYPYNYHDSLPNLVGQPTLAGPPDPNGYVQATGVFVEDSAWYFISAAPPYIWVAVYCDTECYIEGQLYPSTSQE